MSRNLTKNRMIEARKAAGLTLEQVADMVGAKPSTIKRYQSSGVPDYELARRLCFVYKCPIDYMLSPRGTG